MMKPDEATGSDAGETPTSPADPADGGRLRPDGSAPLAGSARLKWLFALLAGLAAGVVAWAIGEAVLIPDSKIVRQRGTTEAPVATVGLRNGMASFGAFGAALGLGLGLAGGAIRRSIPRAAVAGIAGLLLAGASGMASARLLVPVYFENREANDLVHPLMVHGGIWGAVAIGAGLAFGLGLGGWDRTFRMALAGAGAALLAAVVYEVAGSLLFPSAMTDRPVSATWETRLLARLLVALSVAVGAGLAAGWGGGAQASGRRDQD